MRRPDAVTMIAIWYFINVGFAVLGLGGMTIGLLGVWTEAYHLEDILFGTLGMGIGVMAIFFYGIACGVVGWGLWALKEWARSAAIVLAVLQLLLVPLGTILGIIILFYLGRNAEAKAAFRGGPGAPPAA